MYHENSNNFCGCGNASSCSRNGERIMVNQASCSNDNMHVRSRCSCANTYRPSGNGNCSHHTGCGNQGGNNCNCCQHNCNCQRPCPPRPCPPRPCPPRPCPPRPCPPRPCPPRPSCEERCREQYHQCMRNCRMRDDDVNMQRGYGEADYEDIMMNEENNWGYEE